MPTGMCCSRNNFHGLLLIPPCFNSHLYFSTENFGPLVQVRDNPPSADHNRMAMGYWNNGMLEYWVWRHDFYFYVGDIYQKLIRLRRTAFHTQYYPNITFFHHSIGQLTATNTSFGYRSSRELNVRNLCTIYFPYDPFLS